MKQVRNSGFNLFDEGFFLNLNYSKDFKIYVKLKLTYKIKFNKFNISCKKTCFLFFKTNNVFASIRYWHFIFMYNKVNTLVFFFWFFFTAKFYDLQTVCVIRICNQHG